MVQQLLDVDQVQELSVAQTRNYCVVFVIPEDEKLRWRIIKHPKAINDALHDIVEELAVSKTNATRRAARFAVLDHPDASRYGIGALCLGPDSERAFMRPREWTMKEREDWSLGLSTVAEPRALVEAVRWAAQLFPQCTVEVYSDHQPFVEAFWRGGSFSPGYNDALLTLGELNVPLVLYHVAGESMPADGMSRGVSEAPTALDWQNAAKWVEAAALSSLRYYRIIGGGIGARTFSSGGARHPHTHKAHSVSMP